MQLARYGALKKKLTKLFERKFSHFRKVSLSEVILKKKKIVTLMHVSSELSDLMKCQIARSSHTNDDEIPIRVYTISSG